MQSDFGNTPVKFFEKNGTKRYYDHSSNDIDGYSEYPHIKYIGSSEIYYVGDCEFSNQGVKHFFINSRRDVDDLPRLVKDKEARKQLAPGAFPLRGKNPNEVFGYRSRF